MFREADACHLSEAHLIGLLALFICLRRGQWSRAGSRTHKDPSHFQRYRMGCIGLRRRRRYRWLSKTSIEKAGFWGTR